MNADMGPEFNPPPTEHQPIKLDWAHMKRLKDGCSGDVNAPSHKQHTNMTDDVSEMTNSQAKIREESTKKALILKRKELRWKLMQASQTQNQAKLLEIKTSLRYHKQKLSRAQSLAVKLRDKYVKLVRSAKLTEIQLKAAETQLAAQEKYVADEKMQLTKLAIECMNVGKSLYGADYKLPENHKVVASHRTKCLGLKTINRQLRDTPAKLQSIPPTQQNKMEILKELSPFLRRAREVASATKDKVRDPNLPHKVVIDDVTPSGVRPVAVATKKRKKVCVSRLSSLYDLNDSILKSLASYRLTRKFAQIGTTKLTDLAYSHNIHPRKYVCLPDLLGECPDKSCPYQHKSNYYMTDLELLADLLSYRPSIAGWIRNDDDLDESENYRLCRIKLKQYAAQLISKNADKTIDVIARAIIGDIRNNDTDIDLLLMRRQLPKMTKTSMSEDMIKEREMAE